MLVALVAAFLGQWNLSPSATGLTPILTYHDVIDARGPGSVYFDCTAKELDDQMRWLHNRGAQFVTLDQIYRHLAQGAPLPKRAIAITFADNYEGFYRLGLPILRKWHVPVAMFVHTGYVGDQHNRPKMSWDQLKVLDKEGLVSFYSQTVTHPPDVRVLNESQLRHEMVDSKLSLEQHLGHPCPYIAYPNGKFNLRVAKAAQAAGYLMGFTEKLTPSERSPNLFMVSRYLHLRYRQAWSDAGR